MRQLTLTHCMALLCLLMCPALLWAQTTPSSPNVQLSIGSPSFTQGTIDTDVLSSLIQEKQEEVQIQVFHNIIIKSFNKAKYTKDFRNFTTYHFIYDVMEELGLFPSDALPNLKVLLVHFDEKGFDHGLSLLQTLRKAGIPSDIYPEASKFKKQMTYANKIKVPYTIAIGDNEIESGQYPLKDMESGSSTLHSASSLPEALK